jgi:membrane-associated protease RseP (regulator of RpoE activity)
MNLLGWLIFLFALLFSVMLHEAGHFVTAKKFGMKVTRFFVGFGPTIWSTWRGETEYGVKALPVGGFVKIIGMHSLDDVDDPADEPRSFRQQPAWQRIIVLCAGSFMHVVLAFVLVAGLALTIGMEIGTNQLASVAPCVAKTAAELNNGTCGSPKPSPAKLAGLKVGDTITAFNGKPVSNGTQLSNAINGAEPGSAVTLTVRRGDQTLTLHTKLAQYPGSSGGYLGIGQTTVFQIPSPLGAVTDFGSFFWQELSGSVHAIGALPSAIPKLFSENRANTTGGQVSSMIGVANATGQAVAANVGWRYKVEYVVLLIAALNVFVGAFNMLPLLPLDGGHVAAVAWEWFRSWFARLRGRADPGLVDMRKLVPVMFSIFMVLVFFSMVVLLADIVNPVNMGR